MGLNLEKTFPKPISGSVGRPNGVGKCEFGHGNDRLCIA